MVSAATCVQFHLEVQNQCQPVSPCLNHHQHLSVDLSYACPPQKTPACLAFLNNLLSTVIFKEGGKNSLLLPDWPIPINVPV